jgi:hypothetical protein
LVKWLLYSELLIFIYNYWFKISPKSHKNGLEWLHASIIAGIGVAEGWRGKKEPKEKGVLKVGL